MTPVLRATGAGGRKALAHTRAALTSRTELHQGLFCIRISDRHLAEATLQSREWELPCRHRGVREAQALLSVKQLLNCTWNQNDQRAQHC